MYYVTMTDKALSGWGYAKGKINKLIFLCHDYQEACKLEEHAIKRGDMNYINICSQKPYYPANRYFAQIKTRELYPNWYK